MHNASSYGNTALYWSVYFTNWLDCLSALHVYTTNSRNSLCRRSRISICPFYFATCHTPLPVHVLHVCTYSFVFKMICFFRHSFWNRTMQTKRFKVGISISRNYLWYHPSVSASLSDHVSFHLSLFYLLRYSFYRGLSWSAEPVFSCYLTDYYNEHHWLKPGNSTR